MRLTELAKNRTKSDSLETEQGHRLARKRSKTDMPETEQGQTCQKEIKDRHARSRTRVDLPETKQGETHQKWDKKTEKWTLPIQYLQMNSGQNYRQKPSIVEPLF